MASRWLIALSSVCGAWLLAPTSALAVTSHIEILDLTGHWTGLASLAVFAVAYLFVVAEESLGIRKSKPALVAAGVIWVLVAWAYLAQDRPDTAEQVFRRGLEYYTELFLFLLAAMTYINALSERGLFASLHDWLAARGSSLKTIYWTSGALAFVISPLADNLTTALVMATVVVSVAGGNRAFVTLGCVNVVVAANAGGVFSPFGDVTTLLVWQRGIVEFQQFFALFLPALANWLVPAAILSLFVPQGCPEPREVQATVAQGGWTIAALFVLSIACAVAFENFLNLPAAVGMMTGLGLLKLYGYWLKRRGVSHGDPQGGASEPEQFDIFRSLQRAEWDTLMFLYGILMAVSGLAALGYLMLASQMMYGTLGATTANILVGVLSAFVENVPMMFTVLGMGPDMALGQWLLVTLTTGVGGSLLAIGSAAGVAVMGQARGVYTFLTHLKWAWAIALGYAAGIWVHFTMNATSFG